MPKSRIIVRAAMNIGILCVVACMPHSSESRAAAIPRMPLPVLADNDIQALMGSGTIGGTRDNAGLGGLSSPKSLRLSGGLVNRKGSVYAVIFPMAYGLRRPAWKEQQIAYQLFGVAGDSLERADGVAARLADASRGVFRLNGSMVMPMLVDPDGNEAKVMQSFRSQAGLVELANKLITPWLTRVNLASYDNDGPDGLPSSGDDDGKVDLPVVLVETDNFSGSAMIMLDQVVRTGPGARFKARLGSVLMLALPRSSGLDPDNLNPTLGVIRALGVRGEPIFTLGHPAGELSVEARLQLGWVEPTPLVRSGNYNLAEGVVYVVPVLDVPGGGAKWLVETAGDKIYATRVVKRQDGNWSRTEQRIVDSGQSYALPLTLLGEAGRVARIGWWSSQPSLSLDLSSK